MADLLGVSTIKIWDIDSGSCDNTVTFPSSVIGAQLHPSGQWCVVRELGNKLMTAAVLIDLSKNDKVSASRVHYTG